MISFFLLAKVKTKLGIRPILIYDFFSVLISYVKSSPL